jgi:hypothetical protein
MTFDEGKRKLYGTEYFFRSQQSFSYEIFYLLSNPNVHHCVNKNPPPVPLLSQIN